MQATLIVRTLLCLFVALTVVACNGGGGSSPNPERPIVDDVTGVTFSAARQSITSGESTSVVWSVPNGTSLSIQPDIGTVQNSGSVLITPAETTLYTLTGDSEGVPFALKLTVNVVPLADVAIQASSSSGTAPLRVTFTPILASATAINRIFWDFEGDGGSVDAGLGEGALGFDRLSGLASGTANYDVTGQDVTYVYNDVGNYTARVRVLDVDGNAADASFDVVVADALSSANFRAEPNSGTVPFTVSFSSRATDAQGISSYAWDIDSDGITDLTRSSGSFRFEEPGEYAPTVQITDRQGQVTTLTSPALQVSAYATAAPTVRLRVNDQDGEAPHTVEFAASVSGVDDAQWTWDLNGDGTPDSTAEAAATFTYNEPGTYYAKLVLRNANGSIGTAVRQIDVTASATLAVTQSAFDPTAGQSTQFVLESAGSLMASIDIKDERGVVVNNLLALTQLPAGSNSFSWNGTDNAGNVLPPGAYSPVVSYQVGDSLRVLELPNESGNRVFYPSAWGGGSCRYSSVDCGSLAISANEIEPFNNNPVVYAFDTLFNARMTGYVTVIGSEDFAPASFFRDRVMPKGSYSINWFGEGTDGKLLPYRDSRGYLPAIFGITLPDTTVVLTHDTSVSDLTAQPNILFPDNDQRGSVAQYTFTLSKAASVELRIDSTDAGVEVYRKTFNNVPAGQSSLISWNGRNNTGDLVAPGGYRISISAVDSFGLKSLPVRAMQRVRY